MAKSDTEIYNPKTGKYMSREELEKRTKADQVKDRERATGKKESTKDSKDNAAVLKTFREQIGRSDDEKEKTRLRIKIKVLEGMKNVK